MALVCKDTIEVETNHGLCQVELLYGSITQISKDDPVDVLVVSAFPGDYSPTPTSVIGALLRDLKISVRNLSKDKEEDLRRFFSCWWSKPLPESLGLPFTRLMCFEGGFKRGKRPPSVVGEVFRSLVSLCKNKDIKVIMPLLAAGDQGYSQKMMLRLIVDAAIHWMQIGLPLRALKIVIYCRNPENVNFSKDPLLVYFQELKRKWQEKFDAEKDLKKASAKYDVYLSYCPSDETLAQSVRKQLSVAKKDVNIFAGKQEMNNEESWQEEIYQVMISCTRVVTLLTPAFLSDSTCIEQYNIALCCTRDMKRDYLAPLYISDIEQMPTYMCLIQYVDCRPQDQKKISSACTQLCMWLTKVHMGAMALKPIEANESSPSATERTTYEVFISYSHANAETAEKIRTFIHTLYPYWRIFIDTSGLQAGSAWQSTLYNSIEASKVMLALISPTYLASKVCQEEYNLAVFLEKDGLYKNRLLPVVIGDLGALPHWCQAVEPITNVDLSQRTGMSHVAKILKSYVKAYDESQLGSGTDVNRILSNWRSENIEQGMPYFPKLDISKTVDPVISEASHLDTEHEIDVFLSYHESDQIFASYFVTQLKRLSPSVIISQPVSGKLRLDLLDKAKVVVPFISTNYVNTDEVFEELNIGMCRHRVENHLILLPVLLEPLRPSPAFLHTVCTFFAFQDPCWDAFQFIQADGVPNRNAACLRTVASCIAQYLADPSVFEGQFKTLLNLKELIMSTSLLKEDDIKSEELHPVKFVNTENRAYATDSNQDKDDTNLPHTEVEARRNDGSKVHVVKEDKTVEVPVSLPEAPSENGYEVRDVDEEKSRSSSLEQTREDVEAESNGGSVPALSTEKRGIMDTEAKQIPVLTLTDTETSPKQSHVVTFGNTKTVSFANDVPVEGTYKKLDDNGEHKPPSVPVDNGAAGVHKSEQKEHVAIESVVRAKRKVGTNKSSKSCHLL